MSIPVDPPLWSAAQQSWLQAMGYTVFVDGNVEAAVPDTGIELGLAVAAQATQPAPAAERTAPAPRAIEPDAPPRREPARRAAPASTDDAMAAAPRERATGGRRPAVRMPDRLQMALLRASGRNPAEPETQALMAGWNLDELRANPAAKRALWPQLRALRKRGQG